MTKKRVRETAISLYTGAGGLDLGFEAAGFETRVAIEMDNDCVATLRANRDWPVIHRSIHEIPTEEILSVAGIEPGEADVLIGGPPCQPFPSAAIGQVAMRHAWTIPAPPPWMPFCACCVMPSLVLF